MLPVKKKVEKTQDQKITAEDYQIRKAMEIKIRSKVDVTRWEHVAWEMSRKLGVDPQGFEVDNECVVLAGEEPLQPAVSISSFRHETNQAREPSSAGIPGLGRRCAAPSPPFRGSKAAGSRGSRRRSPDGPPPSPRRRRRTFSCSPPPWRAIKASPSSQMSS